MRVTAIKSRWEVELSPQGGNRNSLSGCLKNRLGMVFRSTAALYAEVLPYSCVFDASEIPHIALWQNKSPVENESTVLFAVPQQEGWPRNWQHLAAERGLCAPQIVGQKGRTRCFVPFHVA